nr:MaoC family dehydratase [Candidatus Sigynarchaeota archaeon]
MDIKLANWDDFKIGDKAYHSKTITEADITLFAGISGDFNPLHVNETYAKSTQFGRRVAHGGLSFTLISCLLGMKLPGPGTLHVSQKLDFRKPVFAGDTLTAEAEVIDKFTKKEGKLKFLKIKTNVYNQDNVAVTEGEAVVIIL